MSSLIKIDNLSKHYFLSRNTVKAIDNISLKINKKEYVALDIGLSPPHRMKSNWEKNKKNFIDFYLKLYINNF